MNVRSILFLLTVLLLPAVAHSQETTQKSSVSTPVPEKIKIEVRESMEKMSLGTNNCLKIYIPNAQSADVAEDFATYMKGYNAKASSKKGEYFFDNAEIKQFGNNLVDVYSTTEQKAGGVELSIFFDLGGAYLNSSDHPDKYKAAENFVKKFGKEEAAVAIGIKIEASQKVIDTKMKEYNSLVKQDSALTKKIRDCQAIINQAQIDQQTSRTGQDTKKKEIAMQQQSIDAMKTTQAGIE